MRKALSIKTLFMKRSVGYRSSPDWSKKLTRAMKLTTAILLAGCLQVSARGFSQTVTLSEKHARLETIFQDIRKQTGYEFLYNSQMLADAKRVDIQVANASVEDALRISLQDQPFTYVIKENTIVIVPKSPTPVMQPGDAIQAPPPSDDIQGRIMDSLGNPLSGASVMIKGGQRRMPGAISS
jgi:TonB-dependent starch-binding outer membrane protein SusC